jgi:hypothetical protein
LNFKVLILTSVLIFIYSSAHSRIVTQIIPTLTITEEYNDNYFQTESGEEEWVTTYGLGFTMGFLNQTNQIYLSYTPEYRDFKNLDDRDGLDHNANLDATFRPTRHTTIEADLGYDGHDGNQDGESWAHNAGLSMETQLSKSLSFDVSHSYTKEFDQQSRTGTYTEHETNLSRLNIRKEFGAMDAFGFGFTHEMDEYKLQNPDENTRYEPTFFFNYWLSRVDAIETNLAYEKTDFEMASEEDINTWSGNLRYRRRFNRHFDGYINYRHYLSQRDSGDHQIFHPSAGIDWEVTQDSGISLGLGVMFHQWDNENDDDAKPFIDFDAYKVFNFSRRGALSITGSSGYEETGDEAESLGFRTYYEVGGQLDYRFTEEFSSNLTASYRIEDFEEDDIDRKDQTTEIGVGLTWIPTRWLQFSLNGSHINFDSDDAQRNDYTENRIFFSITLTPEEPIRATFTPSREYLEERLFTY